MAAYQPFEANDSATVGQTVSVVTGSTGATIVASLTFTSYSNSLYVANRGGNMAWIRFTGEASPTATVADIPMFPNQVYLFANPKPNGGLFIGVMVSVTTSPNTVYVTPGQGGS